MFWNTVNAWEPLRFTNTYGMGTNIYISFWSLPPSLMQLRSLPGYSTHYAITI